MDTTVAIAGIDVSKGKLDVNILPSNLVFTVDRDPPGASAAATWRCWATGRSGAIARESAPIGRAQGYVPDEQEKAPLTVLEQAELACQDLAA